MIDKVTQPTPKVFNGEIRKFDGCLMKNNGNNSLTVENKIINLSDRILYICMRDSTITTLPAQKSGPYIDALLIGYTTRNYAKDVRVLYGEESSKTLLMRELINKGSGNGETTYYEELIPVQEIKSSTTGLFIPSSDIMVTDDLNVAMKTHHPFCAQRIHNSYLVPSEKNYETETVNVNLRVINNNDAGKLFYTVFHDTVMVLRSIEEPALENGVYVTGLTKLNTNKSNERRMDIRYSFEDVYNDKCPIQLFDFIEDAKSYLHEKNNRNRLMENRENDLKRMHEIEINKMKKESDLRDEKFKENKHGREHEMSELKLEMERELNKLKIEREKEFNEMKKEMEMESIKMKKENDLRDEKFMENKYEREEELNEIKRRSEKLKYERDENLSKLKYEQSVKNNNQRNWSEGFRTLGIIVAGGLSILALMKK